MLSNILMYEFDTRLADAVRRSKVVYTRYADDLTFSAKRTGFLTGVEAELRRIIRDVEFPSLAINEAKTILATQKYKRMVTGLILTNDRKVSIGYRRKREIRAALHHQVHGRLGISDQARLAGLLAFVNAVEPDFLANLASKYGQEVLTRLKSVRTTRISSEN
jgi:RNA-directed DNA polymerase